MKHRFTILILIIFGHFGAYLKAQTLENELTKILSYEEYLGFVKQHHPLAKQAALVINEGEANLLKARGGFDPKIEVDYDRKKFKGTEYYDQLNATFKIPTWYGIELKANFEENTGEFLNREGFLPSGGLYNAGVSFSLGRGLLINDRMAHLKKARIYIEQTEAERDILINNLLFNASEAYFNWLITHKAQAIHEAFLENALKRLQAVSTSVMEGDKAAIDSTEARIIWQNRQLDLEAARLKNRKATLVASNFLWLNGIPLELENNIIPTAPNIDDLKTSLFLDRMESDVINLDTHPKIKSLSAKIKSLIIDRSEKRNMLLPQLDFQYNFLTPKSDQLSSLNTANYKAFVNFNLPLFLRKERGDAKLANIKLKDANFERSISTFRIRNKITAIRAEISSLETQSIIIHNMVKDYTTLVAAEERKFELGESSLFLINSREQKLIDVQLKQNQLLLKQFISHAKLFNSLGISIP